MLISESGCSAGLGGAASELGLSNALPGRFTALAAVVP